MATAVEIQAVREYIGEPNDVNGWTDERLTLIIDANGLDMFAAAAEVWGIKAANYAGLVDVTEAGSSRKMSDLSKNALAMQRNYSEQSLASVVIVSGRPRTRAIVRPDS